MLFQQALFDIPDHAAKYAGEGGLVGLRLRCEGATVRLAVADSGPGIPAEDCAAVFEIFIACARATTCVRARAWGSPFAWLPRAMGGTVTAGNAPARGGASGGAVLTIRLPVPA